MEVKSGVVYNVEYTDLFGKVSVGVGIPYSTKGDNYTPNAIGVVWYNGGVSSIMLTEKIKLTELSIKT